MGNSRGQTKRKNKTVKTTSQEKGSPFISMGSSLQIPEPIKTYVLCIKQHGVHGKWGAKIVRAKGWIGLERNSVFST